MNTLCKSLPFLLLAASGLQAFPPAPYYTIYGIVRDQVGQTISAEGAELILLKGEVEVGRTPISTTPTLAQSYELNVRLDQDRAGTTLYTKRAVATEGAFSLMVEMNGARYFPIEVTGSLTAGKGSERVRLDLTLGEDSDGDGLPDIWEEWQLFQAGEHPDENGDWPIHLLTRDGDYDGDTRNNYDEFLAGTFAGDSSEFFDLEIKERSAERIRFEFFAITGKTYRIERSMNLKGEGWTLIPFGAGTATAEQSLSYFSNSVGIQSLFVTAAPGTSRAFFRLSVR